jgi:NAD(P)-dependent dehydrogenase (short-subunit alcohol dehydrogenase family)
MRPAPAPDSFDRIAVVTGANTGVGKETSRELARAGWTVVMVCRSEARGRAAMEELLAERPEADLRLELCDLESLEEVRDLAIRLSKLPRLDALVNNAGLFRRHREHTPDGYERTLAVNHLGHFLLTLLLEERLRAEGARIVNVSSNGHRRARLRRASLGDILRGTEPYSGVTAYGDSKLANILFTRELSRRWGGDGVLAFAVHPGVLATEIWDRNSGLVMRLFQWWKRFMDPPSVGGEAVSRLVLDPEVASRNGEYFDELEPARPSSDALDEELARSLWEESLEAVGGQTPLT